MAVFCGAVLMGWPATARAQEKLDKNAQFCEDFDQNVIIMGKLDEASKYLTEDFKEHNQRLTANGLAEFLDKMKAMQAARGAGGGNRGQGGGGGRRGGGGRGAAPAANRTVFSHDDVVVFVTPQPERPNPQNPGQTIPASTHFDVYKLRNGKIAEHWD
jgi:predicted SnoaL-like aldol condensation-catalyzing enzyme